MFALSVKQFPPPQLTTIAPWQEFTDNQQREKKPWFLDSLALFVSANQKMHCYNTMVPLRVPKTKETPPQ